MLSIIVCSISPERLNNLQRSVEQTIGDAAYEFIAIDNREKKWPIAKVYNYGASQAKYPYLFFVHEDVLFYSSNWANIIENKLAEPDCGVIGFAGCRVKMNVYSGWWQRIPDSERSYYWYRYNGDDRLCHFGTEILSITPFKKVVTLDGFAMFVRRDVWEKYPFDEKVLTGFHCYDLDFSMGIAQHYRNYVCTSVIQIQHLSNGSFDNTWRAETIRLHDLKWKFFLPLKVEDFKISENRWKKYEEKQIYNFCKDSLREGYNGIYHIFKEFCRRPYTIRHIRNILSFALKCVFYKGIKHPLKRWKNKKE